MAHTVDAATAKVEEEEQAAVVVPPSVRCSPHIILNDGEWTLPVPIDFHRRRIGFPSFYVPIVVGLHQVLVHTVFFVSSEKTRWTKNQR